jgi:F-type H+-transporting ATPase subunit b
MAEPTHNASTEPPPKTGHGEFPPFQTETFASQLFWLVIAFVLLYVLMSKIALPRVAPIIEGREKKIEDDLAEAGNLKTQSDETMAAYEKALADARVRAQAIVIEEREKQAFEAAAHRKGLEDELNRKIIESENTIAAAKQAAMSNVGTIAEEAARAIVERLIGRTPG